MSTTTRLITADELLVMPPHDENGNQCRFGGGVLPGFTLDLAKLFAVGKK